MDKKRAQGEETKAQRKVALVTGASSGLGWKFCEVLAQRGFRVIATARRTHLLHALIDSLNHRQPSSEPSAQDHTHLEDHGPPDAAAIQMDVSSDEQQIDAVVEQAWQAFGRIDVLVNNAGFRGDVKSSLDLDSGEWDKVISTNLRGSWLVSKAVGRRMRAAKLAGSIINISSTASLERTLLTGNAAYAASKAALNQLTKVMAIELGKYNIRVNAIAAGIFKSEITQDLFKKPWIHRVAEKSVPMQRWGIADPDLTSLVGLLASDSSSYITGAIFIVDGGQSILGVPVWSSL